MENELSNISKTILELYAKNLAFLKNTFPTLYNRIEELSQSIENGTHKEKYTLEYRDGYFDILNHEVQGWYYNTDSYKDADERAKVTNKTSESSLELLRKNPLTGKLLNGEIYKDVTPIVEKLNDIIDFDNIEYNDIFKHIFIGTGLGLHIQSIEKVLNPLQTLIIEEELEIFRLSLFITDYTIFEEGRRKLFLFVGEDKNNLKYCLNDFAEYQTYMNFNVKYTTLLTSAQKYKDEIVSFFATKNVAYFPYKIILQNIGRTLDFIKNKDRFLNAHSMLKKPLLSDRKVLMIAAGPSLNSYMDWIKENQNKFIIVTVDVIIKKLEKNNIIPDIVVSIDPSHLCSGYMTTEDPNYLNNSAFLFLSQQDESVMELVKDKRYYFSQSLPIIDRIGYLGSTPNVGTYSFELACYLGATEIYTIGNDAAFDQESGVRYASDAGLILEDQIENNYSSKDQVTLTDVIEVEGNLEDTVKTNRDLIKFKYEFEGALTAIKNRGSKVVCYNLSNGAKIDGFEPLLRKDFELKASSFKSTDKSQIISGIDDVSEIITDLNYDDDIKIINSVISRTKKFQKLKITSKDVFLQNKLDLMIWILEQTKKEKNTMLGIMFLQYTALVDIYINFYMNLNQKGIHSITNLVKVSELWAKGILTLFKEMKNLYKKID